MWLAASEESISREEKGRKKLYDDDIAVQGMSYTMIIKTNQDWKKGPTQETNVYVE